MQVLKTTMQIPKCLLTLSVFSLVSLAATQTHAAVIVQPTNLDSLSLGPAIIGPLGPEVPGTFTIEDGSEIGTIRSSVFCPVGTEPADCPSAALDTYIYRHIVTPDLENLTSFTAGFPVSGFTGVAGYSFGESGAAGGSGNDADFSIVFNNDTDNTLVWNLNNLNNSFFERGETITFFWQSTIPPAGPIGDYSITNNVQTGTARGPAPALSTTPVPEPSNLVLLALFSLPLWRSRFASNK